MSKAKIQVHVAELGGHFLRLWIHDDKAGAVCLDTAPIYSKPEADFRAMVLSSGFGFGRDELPTYPKNDLPPDLG